MSFMLLEPLNGSLTKCETDCQLIGRDGHLIGCDGQLITCDDQLIACFGQLIVVYSNSSVSVFQLISQCFPTNHFRNGWANFSLMAGLAGKPSPAAAGRYPWPAPPQSSRSCTKATVSEKGNHFQEKIQFYGPLMVHYPLYSRVSHFIKEKHQM